MKANAFLAAGEPIEEVDIPLLGDTIRVRRISQARWSAIYPPGKADLQVEWERLSERRNELEERLGDDDQLKAEFTEADDQTKAAFEALVEYRENQVIQLISACVTSLLEEDDGTVVTQERAEAIATEMVRGKKWSAEALEAVTQACMPEYARKGADSGN